MRTNHLIISWTNPRPLSFLDWTTAMLFWLDFHQTSTNESECSGTTGYFGLVEDQCYTSLCLLALATSCSSHPVHIKHPQGQHPPTFTHYYESTSPPEVWDLLTETITESLKITFQNILVHRSWLVELSWLPIHDIIVHGWVGARARLSVCHRIRFLVDVVSLAVYNPRPTFDPPVEKHCNRLCLTHRRVTIRSTEKYRNSTLI